MLKHIDGIGREMIFTDYDEINRDNILEVINDAFSIHMRNVGEEIFLFDYVAGKQPILEREKEIRADINEKVVINIANRVKNFKVGYEFSNPITYVRGGDADGIKDKKENKDDDSRITALNEMMREQSKSTKDVMLADSFKTCGLGYRLIMPNEDELEKSIFKIATLNPMMAFVVYKNDAFKEPKLGVTYSINRRDGSIELGAWTKKNYFKLSKTLIGNTSFDSGFEVYPWVYGEIPVIEYTNERNVLGRSFSCFEAVIPAMDALNTVNSDRVNDISQFVQSLLWFHNCDIDSDQKKQLVDGNGLIVTKSAGDGKEAKITYLTQTLNQSEIQSYVDYLKQEVQETTGVPMFGISTGGSTGSATSMSNGYSEADTRAQTTEQEFQEPERRALKMIIAIAKHHKDKDQYDIGSLTLSDIQIKFSRNKTYNLADKVNSWATLIKNGADPLRATEIASFTPDAQQFTADSEDMIRKIQESYAKNDTENNTGSIMDKNNPDIETDDKIQQDSSDQPQRSPYGEIN